MQEADGARNLGLIPAGDEPFDALGAARRRGSDAPLAWTMALNLTVTWGLGFPGPNE
ncbi:MAG: hypothetical protein Q4D79_07850 [Propionibacteriaceae bacterium]|nr:hypothetical protein [Propionibacteriaceae bacterium]